MDEEMNIYHSVNHNSVVQPLLTDLYQLTMAYAYWKSGKTDDTSVFDLYFRKNPFDGEFTIFAGLDECLKFLDNFKYSEDDIRYLKQTLPEGTEDEFFQYLSQLTAKDITLYALPEGSVAFPRVPIIKIEGPLIIAQILETTLLTLVNYASLMATNAARYRMVAGKHIKLLEFGLRRAQGPDGGLSASKYAYIGGFDGTSNVLAGKLFNIPVKGTHAHAYITSFSGFSELKTRNIRHKETGIQRDLLELAVNKREALSKILDISTEESNEGELAAMVSFAIAFPDGFIALVDTYDVKSCFTNIDNLKTKDFIRTKRFTAKQMKLLTHNGTCTMTTTYDENCNRLTTNINNNNNSLSSNRKNINGTTYLDDGKKSINTTNNNNNSNLNKIPTSLSTTATTVPKSTTNLPSSEIKNVDVNVNTKNALLKNVIDTTTSTTHLPAISNCSNNILNGAVNNKCQCGDDLIKRDLLKSVGKSFRSGLLNFCAVALALNEQGYRAVGIRIDSGDLAYLSCLTRETFEKVSQRFNLPWFNTLTIVASNDINEDTILSLNEQGHKIDCFGIGTHLVTCQRQPALGCVYKLVEINGQARIKLSQDVEKVTMPGNKNAYRLYNADHALIDLLQKVNEEPPQVGQKVLCRHPFQESKRAYVTPSRVELLYKVYWQNGRIVQPHASLEDVRERVQSSLRTLRNDHKRTLNPTPYKVSVSDDLYSFIHDLWLQNAPIGELS